MGVFFNSVHRLALTHNKPLTHNKILRTSSPFAQQALQRSWDRPYIVSLAADG